MPADSCFPDNADLLIRLLKQIVDKNDQGRTEPEGSTLRDPMIVALVKDAYKELQDANKTQRKQKHRKSRHD
jgi:hypothetical protein